MVLKKYNPSTSSQRGLLLVNKSGLWKGRSLKSLSLGLNRKSGRNNIGRITSRHRGGGCKRKYRLIDFKRNKDGIEAVVERIEYDPNRTAFIALLRYKDGVNSYILAPNMLKVGDVVISGDNVDIKDGNCLPLRDIPIDTVIHNIEMKVGKGGQLVRAAGMFASVIGKNLGYAQVKLLSGEIRLIPLACRATVGMISNLDQRNINIAKAGRNRWLGKRPRVRGVAMNPVDHPHGGGEGKTSGGRHPVTPWGKLTKGKKTRKNKFSSKFIVKSRVKKK